MASFGEQLEAANPVGAGLGIVSGGISSLISGAIGNMFQRKAQKRQQAYNKELMSIAHQYEQQNMGMQDQYQRQLMQDANLLNKQSLERAGYSTADPQGTGSSAPSMSMPSTAGTGSAGAFGASFPDVQGGISALANAANLRSVTRLNDIESQYRAKELEGRIGLYQEQIRQIKETLPEQVNLLKEQVAKTAAEKKVPEKQVEQINAQISKLEAETKGINIDNKYKGQLNDRQIQKISVETAKLWYEGKIEAVKANLAKYGILTDSNMFGTIAAIIASGDSSGLQDQIIEFMKSFIAGLPDAAGQILSTSFDSYLNMGKGIYNKGKELVKKGIDALKK